MTTKKATKLSLTEIQPEVRAGQVWREMDPRFAVRKVMIWGNRLGLAEVKNVATGKVTTAQTGRFNGKRSGYGYFAEDNTPEALAAIKKVP